MKNRYSNPQNSSPYSNLSPEEKFNLLLSRTERASYISALALKKAATADSELYSWLCLFLWAYHKTPPMKGL